MEINPGLMGYFAQGNEVNSKAKTWTTLLL